MNNNGKIRQFIASRDLGQLLVITAGLVLMIIVFSFLNPNFMTWRNIENLLRAISPILLIGMGQGFVLITGNIDLSIGSVIGMSTMTSATLMTMGVNPWVAMMITLCAGLSFGFTNGILVAKVGLPPFIATLGTMTIARGWAQMVNGSFNTDSIGDHARGFSQFFYYGRTLGVFTLVWIALALFLIFNFLLSRTRLGRHIYATGSNKEAAKLSGVAVDWVIVKAYLISSFLATTVGLTLTAQARMGSMDAGTMHELFAVAAAVIGGISTFGGKGRLVGVIVGASIWVVLQNGLQFAGAPLGIRNIVIGAIIIVSVSLDVVVRANSNIRKVKKAT